MSFVCWFLVCITLSLAVDVSQANGECSIQSWHLIWIIARLSYHVYIYEPQIGAATTVPHTLWWLPWGLPSHRSNVRTDLIPSSVTWSRAKLKIVPTFPKLVARMTTAEGVEPSSSSMVGARSQNSALQSPACMLLHSTVSLKIDRTSCIYKSS